MLCPLLKGELYISFLRDFQDQGKAVKKNHCSYFYHKDLYELHLLERFYEVMSNICNRLHINISFHCSTLSPTTKHHCEKALPVLHKNLWHRTLSHPNVKCDSHPEGVIVCTDTLLKTGASWCRQLYNISGMLVRNKS